MGDNTETRPLFRTPNAEDGWLAVPRFNRWERGTERVYEERMGIKASRECRSPGRVKFKLAHLESGSILVPDQIYLRDSAGKWLWLQPLGFLPPLLHNFGDGRIDARFAIDVSLGLNIAVELWSSDCLAHLPDHSFLFDCTIHGPTDLALHATGDAQFTGKEPELFLFHHTTEDAKASIRSTGGIRTSSWNIQGARKLIQRHHVYFTALDELSHNEDLLQIAMSSISKVLLRTDVCPNLSSLSDMLKYQDEILAMDVYREDRRNRTATVGLWISAADLAPQHIYRHDLGEGIFYEVTSPFIERVAASPFSTMSIVEDRLITHTACLVRPHELIIGEARTVDGLRAPFDEETTRERVLVESRFIGEENPLQFWFQNSNNPLFEELRPSVSFTDTQAP